MDEKEKLKGIEESPEVGGEPSSEVPSPSEESPKEEVEVPSEESPKAEIEIEVKSDDDEEEEPTEVGDEPSPEEIASEGDEEQQQQQQPAEKMLTQSQVNELVGRARQEGRESALRELYGRYGVSDDAELDDVFGKGQAYYDLDDEYQAQGASMKALMAENALLKSKVDESRWDDIKLILGGKGIDITPENIEAMIPSHPEWRGNAGVVAAQGMQPQAQQQQGMPTVLRKLGNEAANVEDSDGAETSDERAKKLFGF